LGSGDVIVEGPDLFPPFPEKWVWPPGIRDLKIRRRRGDIGRNKPVLPLSA
jgi:hypothetical protein